MRCNMDVLFSSKEDKEFVCVGCRTEQNGRNFSIKRFSEFDLSLLVESLMERMQEEDEYFAIVDFSVFDAAFVDGGTIGGLMPREVMYMLQKFRMSRKFKGIKLVHNDTEKNKKLAEALSKI